MRRKYDLVDTGNVRAVEALFFW